MNRNTISRLKPYILISPALLVLLGIFSIGLYNGVLQSLGYIPAVGLTDITLDYYKEVFLDKDFLSSLSFSLFISISSSLISVVIGVIFAYLMVKSKKKLNIIKKIYKFPIVIPHLVVALIVYSTFSQSGILARLLYNIGIINSQTEFPSIIYDDKGLGIIIAYIWKGAPFIAMISYGILKNINDELVGVARNLGANERQVFTNIILPLSAPSIFSAFLILFAYSFGAFEIPFLLGSATSRALPILAYIEYINPDWTNRAYAMSINMILALVSVLLIYIYSRIFKKFIKHGRW